MARQHPEIEAAFNAVADAYRGPVQTAGLRVGIVEVCRNDAATPMELRHLLVRALQSTLSPSVPASIRARPSPQMPSADFSKLEQHVVSAVVAEAHASPTLRPVVMKDRSGRETIEFLGSKRSWMGQYQAQPQLMKKIGGAPVVLPVIVGG